jgi:rhamnosyltransferase
VIYLIYDEDGIVDDYILYWLNAIKEYSESIVVVVNGKLTAEGRRKIYTITEDVFVRENIGFDAHAYKAALEYVGYDNLKDYDECIITNYTTYGPIYSFADFFEKMEESEADFYGMFRMSLSTGVKTVCGLPWDRCIIKPKPISNFWGIKKRLLHSGFFRNFYQNLRPINTYHESTVYYEDEFGEQVLENGFLLDTYEQEKNGYIGNPFTRISYELLKDEKIPIYRKRNFYDSPFEILRFHSELDARNSLDYIAENTEYDTSLIWKNLLRVAHQYDLYRTLQLDYVAEAVNKYYENVKINCCFRVTDKKSIELIKNIIKQIPCKFEAYISCETNDLAIKITETFPSAKIKVNEANPEYIFTDFKNAFGNSDFCLFFNDKFENYTFDVTRENLKERTFSIFNYIDSCIDLFIRNPRLGLLSGPPAYHAELLLERERFNQRLFKHLSAKLYNCKIKVPLDATKAAISPWNGCFIARSGIMTSIAENYELFPFENTENLSLKQIEDRYFNKLKISCDVIAYGTQQHGYYPAYIRSKDMLTTDFMNINYMFTELVLDLNHGGEIPSFREISTAIKKK